VNRLLTLKYLALGTACAALGFAAAFSLIFQSSEESPEFYGAFTAALIAGATLIFAAYYRDNLERKRDERLIARERMVEAIDLYFWLEHCDGELEFIAEALIRIRDQLALENKTTINISTDQFLEIISSHFYGELLERAKTAAKLPPEIAGLITGDLYKTFTIVDRIFILRHASDTYRPSIERFEKYVFVINRRREILQRAAKFIGEYLVKEGALPRFPESG
jgi:hypothetical protein